MIESTSRGTGKTPRDTAAIRRALLRWYRRNARDLPWRRTREPYAVWISEVMLQQTTVAAALPRYERFLAKYPTLTALADASEEDLLAAWSGLGYYRRARDLHDAARIIVGSHRGMFPRTVEALRTLPGVGPYTAGAIASNCFGVREPAVDVNAARVLSRLRGSGRAEQRRLAADLVPARSPGEWNQALMELGARICRPAAPLCSRCPIAAHCAAYACGDAARLPARTPRTPQALVRASCVALRRGGRILLVRRDPREILGGLWELPGTLAETLQAGAKATRRDPAAAIRRSLGIAPRGLVRAGVVRHTVTSRRLEIDTWVAEAPRRIPAPLLPLRGSSHLWAAPSRVGSLAIGAATRKAIALVIDPDRAWPTR